MSYGELVELVMKTQGYQRGVADAFIGSLFFNLATEEQIERLVKLLEEKN